MLAVAASVLSVSEGEPVASPAPAAMPTPVDSFSSDVAEAFTGTSLVFFGGAAAGTAAMSLSGADHAVRLGVQRELQSPFVASSAYYAGYVVPLLAAPIWYAAGLVGGDRNTAGAGAAAIQALVLSAATTAILKVGVGRAYPLHGGDPRAPDRLSHPEYARDYAPFQHLDAAWPSGHTSATISVAAALTGYYAESIAVPLMGYPLGLAIGFGMVVGDRHWASDVVAGALIGHALGYSVGRSFRRRVREPGAPCDRAVSFVPLPGGAAIALDW